MLKNKISSARKTLSRLVVVSCCDMHNGTTYPLVTVFYIISCILIYHYYYNMKGERTIYWTKPHSINTLNSGNTFYWNIISEIVQWQKLYNVIIGPELSFSWTNRQKKIYYKGIYLNFFISYNFSIVSGGHFWFSLTKHEWGFKLKRRPEMSSPWKNNWKRAITKEYYVKFVVCYNFCYGLCGYFGFSTKKTCSAPGKLWDFWQVIKDDHLNNFLLYIIFFHLCP